MKNILNEITSVFYKEKKLLQSFPWFFLIALVLNLTLLTTFSVSIDDELSVFRTDFEYWVGQGRWANYLLQTYIFPQAVIPYLPGLLFITFITASYLIILNAHHLSVNFSAYALFPIFCIFPTWGFMLEFYANTVVVGFGIFLLSIAVWLFRFYLLEPIIQEKKFEYKKIFCIFFVQSLLVATATGIYQTFLFAFFAMGLGVLTFVVLNQKLNLSKVVRSLALLCILLITSYIFYTLILKLIYFWVGGDVAYIAQYNNPELFFKQPVLVFMKVCNEMRIVYLGLAYIYKVSLAAVGILFLLGIFTLLFHSQRKMLLVLAALIILAPFGANFNSGGSLPLRSLLGVPYVLWFFSLVALMYSHKLVHKIVFALLFVALFQMLYANNAYFASRMMTQKHDEMLAASIYERIVSVHPDFDYNKKYPIYFYGAKPRESIYPNVPSTTMAGSFFAWDNGNPMRIVSYMKFLGFNNLEVYWADTGKFLPYFASMPTWPAKDSVKNIEGVTLIKLGH